VCSSRQQPIFDRRTSLAAIQRPLRRPSRPDGADRAHLELGGPRRGRRQRQARHDRQQAACLDLRRRHHGGFRGNHHQSSDTK